MTVRRIYALLVAIDHYPEGIMPLNGCINDAEAMAFELHRHYDHEYSQVHCVRLYNEKATRAAIIEAFGLFKAAGKDDICLFYFAGHGSRIPTTDFWEAFSGYNQCILCADSGPETGNELIDKELSWLIHTNIPDGQPHFVAIMDCCYSGGNTRNSGLVTERKAAGRVAARPLEGYLGHTGYIRHEDGKWSAPKTRHLAFAASKPHQTAKEMQLGELHRGVFTYSFIEVLRETQGRLSYAELEVRVAQKIAMRTYDQIPQLEAIAGADNSRGFLNGAVRSMRRFYAGWNRGNSRWELDAGLMAGIQADSCVRIGEVDAAIRKILPDKTVLEPAGLLDKSCSHEAQVVTAMSHPRIISTGLLPAGTLKEAVERGFAAYDEGFARLQEEPSGADFCVNLVEDRLFFSFTGGNTPVFRSLASWSVEAVAQFWNSVNHVLRWQRLLSLTNPGTRLGEEHYQLQLYRSAGFDWREFDTYIEEPNKGNPAPFVCPATNDVSLAPGFALQLGNTSDRPLFFCVLYLTARYGVDNSFLPGQRLDPGEKAWMSWTDNRGVTRKGIGVTIEERHWKAGLTKVTDYVKIFVTARDFTTSTLNQGSLDILEFKDTRESRGLVGRSGRLDSNQWDTDDWTQYTIPITIVKPLQ
jgi:hypothetical protein